MQVIDRFDARAVAWFLRVFGVALALDVAAEVIAGVWGVHTGRLYPWRHLAIVPLYPPAVLAIEWTLRAAAGLVLAFAATHARAVRVALRVAAPVLFVAALERYSNHGALFCLVTLFLAMEPPDCATPAFEQAPHPALGLVRAQLVIVYVFSALNKLVHGFARGESLANLLATGGQAVTSGTARSLSWAVITAELALPLLLWRAPRAGIAAVAGFHLVLALLVPNVASFGLTMVALAILFARAAPPTRTPDSSG